VNIIVLVKSVPDTESQIQVRDNRIVEEGLQWVPNPYDEYGVEEALRLKEKHGGKVTLITLGPKRAEETLKKMLALGADEGILVSDPAFDGSDELAVARVLAAAIQKVGEYDLVWAGFTGVDWNQGIVGAAVAEYLGLPHVSFVVAVEVEGQAAKVSTDSEGGREVLDVDLPAVLTATQGLNEPRYASLKNIMAVKRKTIPVWDAAELGIEPSEVGAGAARIKPLTMVAPPQRAAGRIIGGTPEEAVKELVRVMHEEVKVI
jgi:electron transfer flavoprotein beta subunit